MWFENGPLTGPQIILSPPLTAGVSEALPPDISPIFRLRIFKIVVTDDHGLRGNDMRKLIAICLGMAMTCGSASAQTGAFKLVIVWHQSGLAVVDYPNAARCEAARKAVEAAAEKKSRDTLATLPPGYERIGPPANLSFCIPG
jgi:hypothetical protein